jgi:hypothetical protein
VNTAEPIGDASRLSSDASAPRPQGITLLALLAAAAILLVPIATPSPLVATLGDVGLVAVVAISLVLAYGLWEMRPWAWPLAVLFWVFGFLDALLLLTAGTANTNLIVSPIVLAYLNQASIRRLFGR